MHGHVRCRGARSQPRSRYPSVPLGPWTVTGVADLAQGPAPHRGVPGQQPLHVRHHLGQVRKRQVASWGHSLSRRVRMPDGDQGGGVPPSAGLTWTAPPPSSRCWKTPAREQLPHLGPMGRSLRREVCRTTTKENRHDVALNLFARGRLFPGPRPTALAGDRSPLDGAAGRGHTSVGVCEERFCRPKGGRRCLPWYPLLFRRASASSGACLPDRPARARLSRYPASV
jgi:hypothetical protein